MVKYVYPIQKGGILNETHLALAHLTDIMPMVIYSQTV